MMENVKKSNRTSVHGGWWLKRSLISFGVVIALLVFTFSLIIVNNNKQEPAPAQIEQTEDTKNQTIPGVYYATAEEVELSGVADAPRSQKGGSIYIGSGSSFTLTGMAIQGHTATYGGAFYVANGGVLNIRGGSIAYNQAVYGGAIYVESGGTVNLYSGVITANAAENAAAIYVADGGNLNDLSTGEMYINYNNAPILTYQNYIAYYDGIKLIGSEGIDENEYTFNLSYVPLNYEECVGYYSDKGLSHSVEVGDVIRFNTVQTATVNGFNIYKLYTKKATPEKLTFTLNDDNNTYNVKQVDTTTTAGVVVIPRQYDGKDVTEIYRNGSSTGYSPPKGAFYNNNKITEIYLPNTITIIGGGAFYQCSELTKIIIPDNVTSISSGAFYGCSGLTNVTIGNSVIRIFGDIFEGCANLQYNEYDNAKYLGNSTNPYLVLMKAKDTLIVSCEINENTKHIYSSAFAGCSGLTSVIIPDGVISIADSFTASGLTSITIPDSVESIGAGAFAYCSGLTGEVVIPDSVTSIGNSAFYGCSGLTSVTIGSGVERIGYCVFMDCDNLSSVTFKNTSGWYRYGSTVDVTDPVTNAINFQTIYVNDEWTHNES